MILKTNIKVYKNNYIKPKILLLIFQILIFLIIKKLIKIKIIKCNISHKELSKKFKIIFIKIKNNNFYLKNYIN
jgi:hypothetical protein